MWLWSDPPGFNCWISFAQVFSCPYLCFISFLYPDSYILEDDTSIRRMQTKQLCVLIPIRTKGEVGTVNMFKPSGDFVPCLFEAKQRDLVFASSSIPLKK